MNKGILIFGAIKKLPIMVSNEKMKEYWILYKREGGPLAAKLPFGVNIPYNMFKKYSNNGNGNVYYVV